MKVKLTSLIFQADTDYSVFSPNYISVFITDDFCLPSKYLTTKSIEETIQEIYSTYTHLDTRYARPILCQVRKTDNDVEIVYKTSIPRGVIGLKSGYILPTPEVKLEDFYLDLINEHPRSIHNHQ
tara:strand:+ start:596 stop:970 length:375 start_codon:yes stop_codon:yes gene_type:complete